jgi:hypothetical protein
MFASIMPRVVPATEAVKKLGVHWVGAADHRTSR